LIVSGARSTAARCANFRVSKVTAVRPPPAIVAPPRTLADLRHAIHRDARRRIFAEIDPIADIERHLVG
jgi:hypothetical protein